MTVREPLGAFGAKAQAELPGPAWLAERRRSALEAFAEAALPTSDDEEWRYGRVDDLSLEAFSPLLEAPASGPSPAALAEDPAVVLAGASEPLAASARRLLEVIGPRCGIAVGLDGAVVGAHLEAEPGGKGVRLASLAGSGSPPSGFGARIAEQPDAFALLAESFVLDGIVVEVPAGVRLELPIVVIHALGPSSAGRAVFPRTFVHLGEAAEATVIEVSVSEDVLSLAVPIVELDVDQAAHAVYLSAQELGPKVWHLGYQASRVARDASLRSFSAAFGGDYARHWSRTALVGEGGESRLFSVYLGRGTQTEEFRTFQEHAAARTRSELVFKGAVADKAHSVYTGLIRMDKGARRADASQTNRNLVLSEEAHAYSVPNLDIQENDVRCSHASAVGPIDPEQRFYLESRGVPTAAAERLILLGFFEDLIERSPHAGFAAHLRSLVTERLAIGGREAALLEATRRA